jgi:hypothetical protein
MKKRVYRRPHSTAARVARCQPRPNNGAAGLCLFVKDRGSRCSGQTRSANRPSEAAARPKPRRNPTPLNPSDSHTRHSPRCHAQTRLLSARCFFDKMGYVRGGMIESNRRNAGIRRYR